jgi:hypothetical protein
MNYTTWSKKKFWAVLFGVFILGALMAPKEVTKVETVKEVSKVEKVVEKEATQKVELSGTGQQASEKFTLKKGLVIFKFTHNGSSNFIVKLLDEDGKNVDLLANAIGNFDGSKAQNISKEGIYLLDIDADGQWTASIE